MSGGQPSNVTQTSVQQLPSWLNNANTFGSSQAQNLYNQGGAPYYPGSTTAPLSSIQESYLTNANNLGQNGNSALNAGTSYAANASNGAYLNANPYLNQTFNQAANAVQNRVGSEFAGSGRNLEASLPVQNDQMNQLATSIYGGNYANERQLQSQAAGMSPGLNQAGLSNLGAQAGAGTLLQNQAQNYMNADANRFSYNANLPYQNLSNYMNTVNSLSHGNTTSNTQPVFHNQTAGALGGAMAGATAGATIGGPYGALIGGGIGALGGYFGS
jgi:hypothetical protein